MGRRWTKKCVVLYNFKDFSIYRRLLAARVRRSRTRREFFFLISILLNKLRVWSISSDVSSCCCRTNAISLSLHIFHSHICARPCEDVCRVSAWLAAQDDIGEIMLLISIVFFLFVESLNGDANECTWNYSISISTPAFLLFTVSFNSMCIRFTFIKSI